jgi:hypothetical protein
MADWFDSIPSVDFSQLGYDVDLTPIAASLGLTRDQLAEMRDNWINQQRANVSAPRAGRRPKTIARCSRK